MLTVSAPGGVTLDLLQTVGMRNAAHISSAIAIDRNADGIFTVITSNRFQKLSADLLSITPLAGTTGGSLTDGSALGRSGRFCRVSNVSVDQRLSSEDAAAVYKQTGHMRRVSAAGVRFLQVAVSAHISERRC